ncbi:hypothetical protein POM88_012515 [Heracleum sosnowskyi]|uniref:Uncharacterized protein n=1 Tax=Heracleum sosnowskyi TaxID=360622 RepID=A0AAD8IWN1_9APIA|nr:hypothetical protein POM88_012515 [Heracleum sosnowskyi]
MWGRLEWQARECQSSKSKSKAQCVNPWGQATLPPCLLHGLTHGVHGVARPASNFFVHRVFRTKFSHGDHECCMAISFASFIFSHSQECRHAGYRPAGCRAFSQRNLSDNKSSPRGFRYATKVWVDNMILCHYTPVPNDY